MSDIEAIRGLDDGVANAINARDAAAAAACYTADAVLMPPGAPRMDGAAGAEGFWQAAIDAGLGNVSIVADAIDVSGDTAVTHGALSGEMGGQTLTGKYIVVSKRTADGWKIHRDIWNFDA